MHYVIIYRGFYANHQCLKKDRNCAGLEAIENHQKFLYSSLTNAEQIDVIFHTYRDTPETDKRLVQLLKPVAYEFQDSNEAVNMHHSVLRASKIAQTFIKPNSVVINLRFDLFFKTEISRFHFDFAYFNLLWREPLRNYVCDLLYAYPGSMHASFIKVVLSARPKRCLHLIENELKKRTKYRFVLKSRHQSGMQQIQNPIVELLSKN